MRRIPAAFSKLCVTLALMTAMAGAGFAHRFVAQETDPFLLAYMQAGGSLEDICGGAEGTSHSASQTCQACRLMHAAVIPAIEPECTASFGRPNVSWRIVQLDTPARAPIDLARPARAPPAI